MDNKKEEKILKAAEKEFNRNGYRRTSMAQIAAAAGVSVGTLYSCYKNKAALFEAVRKPELKNYDPADEAKKYEILRNALKVFGENGYAAASMDDVAEECGFSKTVLYRYFSSKEELFQSIFNEPKFMGVLKDVHSGFYPTLHEMLSQTGLEFLKLFSDPDRLNLIKIVISESNHFPQLGSLMFKNTVQKVTGTIAARLEEMCNKGLIRRADFLLAARSYFGLLYSFVLSDKILNPGSETFSSEQIVSFAADLFEKGLK